VGQPSTSTGKRKGKPTLEALRAAKYQMPDLENYPDEVGEFVSIWDDYYQLIFGARFWWTESELEAVTDLLIREDRKDPEDVVLLAAQAWILQNHDIGESGYVPLWACHRYSRKPSLLMHVAKPKPDDDPEDRLNKAPMVDRIKEELNWAYTKRQLDTIYDKLEACREKKGAVNPRS
jgi:hypothetical protein